MKSEQLYNILKEKLLPECVAIMKSKGESYSGKEDKLGNFKRCSKLADIPVKKAWFVYFVKHYDALTSYIRGEYSDSESIEGRIKDMINYLILLYAIIYEEQCNKQTEKK